MDSTTDTPLATTGPVAFFKRSSKNKSSLRKRPATPPPASDSDASDYSSTEEGNKPTTLVKKRRKNKTVVTSENLSTAASSDFKQPTFEASRSIASTNDATKQVNWHNENADDYLARKRNPPPKDVENETPDIGGTYKGASSSYGSFIKKSENAPARAAGPLKAPTNIRTITITDYAPDVCKDYKQTGFCGFGDTCKFLHAREDYAQGWKLDRDWEINQKTGKPKAKAEDAEDNEEDKELKDIPFKCVICKGDYKTPITTKCGHYFCEACAIGRYKKNPSCKICGKRTDGVFNAAKGLQKKLDRKREREEERKKKEEAEAENAE